MSDETKALIAITALNKMFEGSYFDICTINSIAKMLGVHPQKEAYDQLHALHCVNWTAMPRELRQLVPKLIQDCLAGGDAIPRFEIAREPSQALAVIDGSKHTRRPLLRRILGD